MAIRQRGDSWQADFSHAGKRHRRDLPSEAEAKRWVKEAKARLVRGESPDGADPATSGVPQTLEALLEKVVANHWCHKRFVKSAKANANDIIDIIGRKRPPSSVKAEDIDAAKAAFMERGLSNGTINRKLAALSKLLHFAARRQWIDAVPVIERPPEIDHRIRWLTEEEEAKALSLMDADMTDLIAVLIDSGLRISEALRLAWRDCSDGLLIAWGEDTKNSASRSVPQTKRVAAILDRRHGPDSLPGGKVFGGLTYWQVNHRWQDVRAVMGCSDDPHFVLHILRHTFCSRLVQRGVPIQVVQELAGHKTLAVTTRYAHLTGENKKDAIALLDKAEETVKPGRLRIA